MQAGHLQDAVEVSLSGREPLRRLGLAGQWQDTFLLSQAAEALLKLGQWDQAHRLAAQALAQATPDDRAELARARHDQGQVEAAIRAADALASRAAAMAPNPLVPGAIPIPASSAVAALFRGERSRLEGRPRAPAFSRFVMIRPVQTTGRAVVNTASALVRGRGVVRNDPDIGLITRERRGPASWPGRPPLGGCCRPGNWAAARQRPSGVGLTSGTVGGCRRTPGRICTWNRHE
jgi:hypothetical protein